jgi:dihydroxyacetone kinase-like protein
LSLSAAVHEQADYLTQLDSAIGDADHGINMKRGLTAAVEALDGDDAQTVGDVLVGTGTVLLSKVGGAAGPLYGTALRAAGRVLDSSTVEPQQLGAALRAGLDALQKLGAAVPGEKTIVDAYAPAIEAYDKELEASGDVGAATRAAAHAAEEGMTATTAMQARKGRASYLGPRSIGHQDPGATSTWLIFRSLADVITEARARDRDGA